VKGGSGLSARCQGRLRKPEGLPPGPDLLGRVQHLVELVDEQARAHADPAHGERRVGSASNVDPDLIAELDESLLRLAHDGESQPGRLDEALLTLRKGP
jgi:hypothetical protein